MVKQGKLSVLCISIQSSSNYNYSVQILETLAQAPYGVLSKTQRVAVATILFKYAPSLV
jgi:hypothetical protein